MFILRTANIWENTLFSKNLIWCPKWTNLALRLEINPESSKMDMIEFAISFYFWGPKSNDGPKYQKILDYKSLLNFNWFRMKFHHTSAIKITTRLTFGTLFQERFKNVLIKERIPYHFYEIIYLCSNSYLSFYQLPKSDRTSSPWYQKGLLSVVSCFLFLAFSWQFWRNHLWIPLSNFPWINLFFNFVILFIVTKILWTKYIFLRVLM